MKTAQQLRSSARAQVSGQILVSLYRFCLFVAALVAFTGYWPIVCFAYLTLSRVHQVLSGNSVLMTDRGERINWTYRLAARIGAYRIALGELNDDQLSFWRAADAEAIADVELQDEPPSKGVRAFGIQAGSLAWGAFNDLVGVGIGLWIASLLV